MQEVQSKNGSRKNINSEFEQNLKRKYSKENSNNNKINENPVKIFESQSHQLKTVSTKRLQPKKPLFGRAFCPRTEEVKLKFLLNGVQDIKVKIVNMELKTNIFNDFLLIFLRL